MISRRTALKNGLVALAGSVFLTPESLNAQIQSGLHSFPIRAITNGPKFHWFGYYDKLQFDPTGRYVLGMEVNFEHRSPAPTDEIRIGMIDLPNTISLS